MEHQEELEFKQQVRTLLLDELGVVSPLLQLQIADKIDKLIAKADYQGYGRGYDEGYNQGWYEATDQ